MVEKAILKGLGASSGKVEGVVKVIISPSEQDKLKEGEILVAPFTTPAYTTSLLKASAFITDVGGLLSHAATVAREMGKPCVVGTKEATKKLRDNMRVVVDGDKGEVYEK